LNVHPEELPAVLENDTKIARIGDLYAMAEEVEAARERLLSALRQRGENNPESPELTIAEARTALGLETKLADALLIELSGEIRTSDSGVSLPGDSEVPPELEEEAAELSEKLQQAGTEPPAMDKTSVVRLLLKREEAVELGGGLFGSLEAAESVLGEIKAVCRTEGEISLAGLRDRLGTSRKYAQAWLEYSDAIGVTRRTGDVRALTRRYR
jgi:selenocysteine-specific elongation factor